MSLTRRLRSYVSLSLAVPAAQESTASRLFATYRVSLGRPRRLGRVGDQPGSLLGGRAAGGGSWQPFCLWLAWGICLVTGCEQAARPQALGSSASQRPTQVPAILDKTFDDIKFDIPVGTTFHRGLLTPAIEQLFGQRIRIRGYIYPTLKKRGLTQFVLVRDNLECCFGPGAALFDCILVRMQPGKTVEYTIRPVAVEGVFQLDVQEFEGTIVAIYQMEGERVE